ncbi:hypothetical protein G3A44_16175 [Ideonella sp. TBM-1]|uniref:NarX-like N-terminal domain-containing protein n=1 Tax=Ideonella livida TaxID=2707176 RepID=A0A7C9PIR6_9BURK|nr:hypothetical protein [Ideonella livida]
MRRRHMLAAGALLAMPALHGQAAVADLNDAINKAGRQRMLSQRLSKAWLALGQQIEPKRAERVLEESMATFDRQLIELKVFAPTPEIRTTYTQLEGAWSEYKGVLVGSQPTAAATTRLMSLDAQVLQLAHQGTQQLEQHAAKPLSQLVNLAGRQRMLSQRMAKFHLALAWKAPTTEAAQQIDAARTEFVAGLDKLGGAKHTSPAIQEQLNLARQQWLFFDAALGRGAAPARKDAENVFVASENILQVMDNITGLYSRLAT